MSLFRSLIAALGQKEAERQGIAKPRPAKPATRRHVRTEHDHGPEVEAYGGPVQPGYGPPTGLRLPGVGDPDELLAEFRALPVAERMKLIDDELRDMTPEQVRPIMDLYRGALAQKWIPLPGPQAAALTSQADILFFGGGAGSGKSSLLAGCAATEHHRARLFRRESVQLRGLIDEVGKILGSREGFNGQEKVWKVGGGAEVEFAHCQYEDDKEKYQGRQADLIGFDEITHFTESQFRYLIGWNRTDRKAQRARVICTGNPPERAEGRWVLSYWAPWLDPSHPNPAADGELRWYTSVNGEDVEVDGRGPHGVDQTGNPIIARSRTFIRSLLKDNPFLVSTGYAATLQSHPEPLRSMLLEGRFDLAVDDDPWQVIPSEWVEMAQRRWDPDGGQSVAMSCLGVDVAQGGADETVLAARHGKWFAEVKAYKGIDTKDGAAVAGLVFATMRDGAEVAVDVGGGWGADTHGQLKQNNVVSHPINWVESSMGKTREGALAFRNQRAEYWWRLREALDPVNGEKIALPPDKTLAIDLATPLWKRTPSGLVQVESKEDIRKRIGRSPDRGDAVVMAWSHGVVAGQHKRGYYSHGPRQVTANVGYASSKQKYRRYG